MTALEHLADDGGRDRKVAVRRFVLGDDDDVLAAREDDRFGQVADTKLGPLQIGDERDRPAELRGDLAHEPCTLGVLGMRPVREIESNGVDARGDEVGEPVRGRGRRSERRHDLRPPLVDHVSQST